MCNKRPKVSIIILNFNGSKYIRNCIESLMRSVYKDFEIIIVDNNSTDNSLECVKDYISIYGDKIKIIKNDRNYGYAKGNNIGARYAKGEFLLFLNVDTEVDSNWLQHLLSVFKDNTIGIAQPKLMLYYDKTVIDSCGHMLTPFGLTIEIGTFEKDIGQYDKQFEIFSVKGAAFIIKRHLFYDIGMFDEHFYMFREETDLCWRAWLRGYKVIFVPSSIVYHVGGGIRKEMQNSIQQKYLYMWYRNSLLMLFKNLENINIIRFIFLFIILNFLHSLILLVTTGRYSYFISFGKALFWCITNIKLIHNKRMFVQKIRRVNDKSVFKHIIIRINIKYKIKEWYKIFNKHN